MRTGRAARTLLLAVPATSLFLSASCRSLQPLEAGAPVPTGAVRVRFAAPRDLLAVSPAGDTIALGGVRALRGRVDAERGDTLAVRVDSVWGTSASRAGGSRLTVVRVPEDRVEVPRFSQRRRAGLILGMAALALVAVLISAMNAVDDLGGASVGY